MKKLLKNDIFWFAIILTFLMSYAYYSSDKRYDKALKGTKYQVRQIKKEPRTLSRFFS